MSDKQKRKPYFWPMVFLAGFGLGAVLWALWMSKVIQQTRTIRDSSYFVPMSNPAGQSPATTTLNPGNAAGIRTNSAVAETNGMVRLPGGTFWMGSADGRPDEQPVHEVKVDGFWIDKTEVSNDQFEKFVQATGYVTVAERQPDPKDFPDADPELLMPGSLVFSPPTEAVPLTDATAWWRYVPGANWRHPEGPDSGIAGRGKYPVVHVAWEDAAAYASGRANGCPRKRSGNMQRAAGWTPAICLGQGTDAKRQMAGEYLAGAVSEPELNGGWIPGYGTRGFFSAQRLSDFTTWRAMFGNGARIGTGRITTREARPKIRPGRRTALIPTNPAPKAGATRRILFVQRRVLHRISSERADEMHAGHGAFECGISMCEDGMICDWAGGF